MNINILCQKTIVNLLFIVFVVILFRNSFITILGPILGNVSILGLFLIFPTFIYLLIKRKFNKLEILIIAYLLYLLILVLMHPILSDYGSVISGIIGFTNLACIFIFWFSLLKLDINNVIPKLALKLFLVCGLVNAIGAIIQFFVSENLFGLISNSVYSNAEVLENVNVNRRAISFIASPQSLSLFLAFSLCVSTSLKLGWFLGSVIRGILLFAGALTISKAFFVFIFVFVIVRFMTLKHFIFMLFGLCFLVLGILRFDNYLGRVSEIAYFASNIEKYSAYKMWAESLNYVMNFPDIFLGKGIGVFSRGAQQIEDYIILYGSTESFFIQLLVETGIVGVSIFFALLSTSLYKLYHKDRCIFSCLLGFCAISLFTPAVYGYAGGLAFYFCFVSGLFTSSRGIKPTTNNQFFYFKGMPLVNKGD